MLTLTHRRRGALMASSLGRSITGTTRSGTEFGAGFAAGSDRLWLMDVLRHVGRGQLSGFAGGAEGNRTLEQSQWAQSAYTEADL